MKRGEEKKGVGDEQEMEVRGECHCGNAAFTAVGKPIFRVFCHCTICRRLGGGEVTGFAGFPVDKLTLEKGELCSYKSSPSMTRYGCAKCCSPLFNVLGLGPIRDSPTDSGALKRGATVGRLHDVRLIGGAKFGLVYVTTSDTLKYVECLDGNFAQAYDTSVAEIYSGTGTVGHVTLLDVGGQPSLLMYDGGKLIFSRNGQTSSFSSGSTGSPSPSPSEVPTGSPSPSPSSTPSASPSAFPSSAPSSSPSQAGDTTSPTDSPSRPPNRTTSRQF